MAQQSNVKFDGGLASGKQNLRFGMATNATPVNHWRL